MSTLHNKRFNGWATEIDYLASEAERQKRIDYAIEQYQRWEREDEIRPLALKWRLTIVFCAAAFGAFVLWEAITWVIDAVLQAVGR